MCAVKFVFLNERRSNTRALLSVCHASCAPRPHVWCFIESSELLERGRCSTGGLSVAISAVCCSDVAVTTCEHVLLVTLAVPWELRRLLSQADAVLAAPMRSWFFFFRLMRTCCKIHVCSANFFFLRVEKLPAADLDGSHLFVAQSVFPSRKPPAN